MERSVETENGSRYREIRRGYPLLIFLPYPAKNFSTVREKEIPQIILFDIGRRFQSTKLQTFSNCGK